MNAIKYLSFVSKELTLNQLEGIKKKNADAVVSAINVVGYYGKADFKLITDPQEKLKNIRCDRVNYTWTDGQIEQLGYADIFTKQRGFTTYVILAEIVRNGKLIGYTVAYEDKSGVQIKNIKLEDALSICKTYLKNDLRAFQNGVYVSGTVEKSEYIRSHTLDFFKATIVVKNKPTMHKTYNADVEESESTSKFTPEQISLLKSLKAKGLPIEKFANHKLSVEQMDLLAKLEAEGVDTRYFATPKARVDALEFYLAEAKSGGKEDIMHYVYPDFSSAQLIEISLGYESGIDYRQYADKNIYANEMAEIRLRLESNLWTGKVPSDDVFSAELRRQRDKVGANTAQGMAIDSKLDKINERKRAMRNS